jgi:hypothetical protein
MQLFLCRSRFVWCSRLHVSAERVAAAGWSVLRVTAVCVVSGLVWSDLICSGLIWSVLV